MACNCQQQNWNQLSLYKQPVINFTGETPKDFEAWSQGVQFGFELQRLEWDRAVLMIGGLIGLILIIKRGRLF